MNIRNGDLILTPINKVSGTEIENFNGVLAYGEQTGHAHRVKGRSKAYTLPNNEMILSLEEDSELTHEEHKTLLLPKGLYLIRREREFDYYMAQINMVKD